MENIGRGGDERLVVTTGFETDGYKYGVEAAIANCCYILLFCSPGGGGGVSSVVSTSF